MTLPLLDRYREAIVAGLRRSLDDEGPLSVILRYHVGLADREGGPADALGKLLRPALVLFTAEELGGSVEAAMPAAVGLELVHGFSLIHDDVQDRDDLRRGRPTVWRIWGVPEAINAGDRMQALAIRNTLEAGPEAAEILLDATVRMIDGQSMDLSFEDRFVEPDDVLRMIDRKTGALFVCAFELGGACAGAEVSVRESLRAIGRSVGRAFQLQDDVLGIWGDGDLTGKPVGSDVRRRKKSYPIVLGAAAASGEDRARLEELYAKPDIDEGDVAWVVGMLDRLAIRSQVLDAVALHVDDAKTAAQRLPVRDEARAELVELIEFLARRQS
jgi:geranylgeranyl diphosphate synthase type I